MTTWTPVDCRTESSSTRNQILCGVSLLEICFNPLGFSFDKSITEKMFCFLLLFILRDYLKGLFITNTHTQFCEKVRAIVNSLDQHKFALYITPGRKIKTF